MSTATDDFWQARWWRASNAGKPQHVLDQIRADADPVFALRLATGKLIADLHLIHRGEIDTEDAVSSINEARDVLRRLDCEGHGVEKS